MDNKTLKKWQRSIAALVWLTVVDSQADLVLLDKDLPIEELKRMLEFLEKYTSFSSEENPPIMLTDEIYIACLGEEKINEAIEKLKRVILSRN